MENRITLKEVLSEGFGIGMRNIFPLTGALFLWILTIWIPYINIGTTIAIFSIPIELDKGESISPLFIFDSKYRQYMGEFFTLIGLFLITLIPAFIFMIVPAFIIGICWSLALLIMLDRELTPTQALLLSSKATNGSKSTIFFVYALLYGILILFNWLVSELGILGGCLSLPISIVISCISLGCTTVFYKKLFLENRGLELNENYSDEELIAEV